MTQELLIEFCLRLSAGLACMMLAVLGSDVGRQFFRTLVLVILGVSVLARLNWSGGNDAIGILLPTTSALSFVGFALWTLERRFAGGCAAGLVTLFSWASLVIHGLAGNANTLGQVVALANGVSSALLLGSMMAAMLLGHTYLISPTMSIAPLRRLVLWVAGAIGGRAMVSAGSVTCQVGRLAASTGTESGTQFWWWMVVARSVIGLVGPSIIAWMVWQTVRIRSTQSATGILYAGVILVFFGELLGQFLGI